MMEGSAKAILQPDLLKAIKRGVKETQAIIRQIKELVKKCGKVKRTPQQLFTSSEELIEAAQV